MSLNQVFIAWGEACTMHWTVTLLCIGAATSWLATLIAGWTARGKYYSKSSQSSPTRHLNALTLNVNRVAFADRRWYSIAGYAKIGAHFLSQHAVQFQHLSFVFHACWSRTKGAISNPPTFQSLSLHFIGVHRGTYECTFLIGNDLWINNLKVAPVVTKWWNCNHSENGQRNGTGVM